MRVKLSKGQMVNIFSAYTHQVGCEEEEKERFCRELNEKLSLIPDRENLILGDDLNLHVGTENEGIKQIHRGRGDWRERSGETESD